ncbi:MAG: hypothetical protein ABMA64_19645 [Myxococcota bacterium]
MVEKVAVDLMGGQQSALGAVFRYEILSRLARAAEERGVAVLAFGFAEAELRLVLEGSDESIRKLLMAVKVGTVRAALRWGLSLRSGPHFREPADDLLEAVVWAHTGPVEAGAEDPLASPWSSHRDLLGFRTASFYDASALAGRLEPRRVHRACGGARLPTTPAEAAAVTLDLLLRLAGAVLGVLPADRKCFRLFVHLAKARGFATGAVASALALTERRVRQLAAEPEPGLGTALVALGSTSLCRVP